MLSLLFLLLAAGPVPRAVAGPPDPCAVAAADSTFLQLWNRDAGRPATDWYRRLSDLAELGVREIILQWTRYGLTDFYHGGKDLLAPVLEAARRHNLKVVVGLQYDPEYWSMLDRPPEALARYLARRGRRVALQTGELARRIQRLRGADVVSGWYIADELDDETALDPVRYRALAGYLRRIVQAVRHSGLDRPVRVSGFSNGRTAPARSAALWRQLLAESGVDVFLFQDGIGAGKLTLTTLPAYLSALDAEFPRHGLQFRVVTELFRQKKGEAGRFEARPAPYNRILRQLDLATRHGTAPPVTFSLPDYLLGDDAAHEALRKKWREALAQCRLTLIQ